jgi:hypothetical protein
VGPDWYLGGATGFLLTLFIYSKFAELLDTSAILSLSRLLPLYILNVFLLFFLSFFIFSSLPDHP